MDSSNSQRTEATSAIDSLGRDSSPVTEASRATNSPSPFRPSTQNVSNGARLKTASPVNGSNRRSNNSGGTNTRDRRPGTTPFNGGAQVLSAVQFTNSSTLGPQGHSGYITGNAETTDLMQTFPPVDPSTTSTTALPYQASGPSYFAPSMPYVYPNGAFYPPGTPSVTSSHNGSTKFLGYSQYPPTVYCNPYSMPGTFPGSPLGPNFINDSAAGPLPAEMQPQFIPQQAAAPCGMTGSVLTATPSFYATPPAAVSFSSNSSSVSGTATTAIPAHPPVLPIILPFPEGSSGSSNGHSPSPNPGDNVETCGLPAANTFGRSSGHQSPQGFHPGCNIQFRQSRISSTHVGFVNTPNDRHFAQNQDGVFSPPLSTPSRTPSISGRSTPAKESRPPSRPQTTTPTPGVTTSDARSESLRSSGLRRESSSTIGSTMNSTVILSPRVSGDFEVSKTNLYIRGLSATASDEWLIDLCGRFGRISSSKAIIDLNTRECKGYGFVMYETDAEAKQAMDALTNEGFQVSFAKESFNAKLKNLHDSESTNIYVSNLPLSLSEEGMLDLFSPHKVISNKILRDSSHTSRGVGFARMETREAAIAVIASLNGKMLQGSTQPLQVRFADSEGQKRLKQQQLYNSHHHSNYSPPSHRFATRPPVPSPYLPSPTGPTIASSAETPPSSARRRLFRGSFGSGSSQSVESVRAMAVTPDSTDLRPASDGAPSSDGSQRDEDESIETGAAGATEANSIPFQEPNPASSSGPPTLYSVVPTYYDSYVSAGLMYAAPIFGSAAVPLVYNPYYSFAGQSPPASVGPSASGPVSSGPNFTAGSYSGNHTSNPHAVASQVHQRGPYPLSVVPSTVGYTSFITSPHHNFGQSFTQHPSSFIPGRSLPSQELGSLSSTQQFESGNAPQPGALDADGYMKPEPATSSILFPNSSISIPSPPIKGEGFFARTVCGDKSPTPTSLAESPCSAQSVGATPQQSPAVEDIIIGVETLGSR